MKNHKNRVHLKMKIDKIVQSKKYLLISCIFWILFLTTLSLFWLFYFLKPNYLEINGFSLPNILVFNYFNNLNLKILTLGISIYLLLSLMFLMHFLFLWIVIKRCSQENFFNQNFPHEKKNSFFIFLFSLTIIFNVFLIFIFLFKLNHYEINEELNELEEKIDLNLKDQDDNQQQEQKEDHEIIAKAEKKIKDLEKNDLIKNVHTENINKSNINIENIDNLKKSSSENLKDNYPEIINIKDMNEALKIIKKNEEKLESITKSSSLLSENELEEARRIGKLIDLKKETLDAAIQLQKLHKNRFEKTLVPSQDKILDSNDETKNVMTNYIRKLELENSKLSSKISNLEKNSQELFENIKKEINIRKQENLPKDDFENNLNNENYKIVKLELEKEKLLSYIYKLERPELNSTESTKYEKYNIDILKHKLEIARAEAQKTKSQVDIEYYKSKQIQSSQNPKNLKYTRKKLENIGWYHLCDIAKSFNIKIEFKKREDIIDKILSIA